MPPENPVAQWITDYSTADRVLRSASFKEVTFKGLVPLLGNVIVTLEGAPHRHRRTIEGRLFTHAALSTLEQNYTQTLVQQAVASLPARFDLVALAYRTVAPLAGQIIGFEVASEQVPELAHLLGALVGGTSYTSDDARFPPMMRREARDQLRLKYLQPAIDKRRNLVQLFKAGKLPATKLPTDLITLLCLHPTETNSRFEMRQIAAEASFYAVAAVDTTVGLIPHLFHHLWHYLAGNSQRPALISNPDFMRAATAEALRLHPAVPTIFRQATEAVVLDKSSSYTAGQTLAIYVKDANLDPAIFGADATSFNPLRPLSAGVRRSGLSFGGGMHLCLGRELATGGGGTATFRLDSMSNVTDKSTDTTESAGSTELMGVATLLVQVLLQAGFQPDLAAIPAPPDPFARDVYHHYPLTTPG